MTQPPPLTGIRVLEFAGLAPGPFAGMLLADYGATVLRLDRAPFQPSSDQLVRRKSSICVNMKDPRGLALIKKLVQHVDILIDPYRPGVLEKAGLSPEDILLKINPRLIVARMTGFRRDGKYSQMAGHDINYIAVSGVLSMLGRKGEAPYFPANILGDFGGGGAMCFLGILLALIAREKNGRGQVVEANMVDGASILATMPRLGTKGPGWSGERGTNMLDGGAPFYEVYRTGDGAWMAVGAIEPQFYALLLNGLELSASEIPDRADRSNWPALKHIFANKFKSKTRAEWEKTFDGTDACVTPVLTQRELEAKGFDQRPPVTLKSTPAYAIQEGDDGRPAAVGQGIGVQGSGWNQKTLEPGTGGEEVIGRWMGWRRGRHFVVTEDQGFVLKDLSKL
ncbi:CoA-transferase family III [Delitschia confertaspora ATCC 74209]|uniref:CoA-transferase family III n=1 Tax=Delitschia confertaspora ATCC 74209 TaxID=1513339 RepID=A0A9P4JQN1_9PLEO|nr:CoA-transferase family III [Delitschia confertaspora ATCC 74209]